MSAFRDYWGRDGSGWPNPDPNGRDLYEVGRIDNWGGCKPWRVFVGWERDRVNPNLGHGKAVRTLTFAGACRVAERARRDPANAETIAREGRPGLRVGTVPAGGSFTVDMSVDPPALGEVTA